MRTLKTPSGFVAFRLCHLRMTVCVSAAAIGVSVAPVHADTIHVPADYLTIQEAIDAANVAGDEVVVEAGTYREAIRFNGKAVHLRSAAGPDLTTIDADGLEKPVVTCDQSESTDTILEGFRISGGTAIPHGDSWYAIGEPERVGAGVYAYRASPTIRRCKFGGLVATMGSGCYVEDGDPVIDECEFSDNRGSAIYVTKGKPIIINSSFHRNRAITAGGAIHMASGRITVADCQFTDNEATRVDIYGAKGGAIFHGSGAGLFVRLHFENNIAESGGAFLGEGFGGSRDVEFVDCTFVDNTALIGSGGGLALNGNEFLINRCTFSGNHAVGGGALDVQSWSSNGAVILDSSFVNNSATHSGGGISSMGSTTIERCMFESNTALKGGGVDTFPLPGGKVTVLVTDTTFLRNEAVGQDAQGGGFYVSEDGDKDTVRLVNCLFLENTSEGVGGGAYLFHRSRAQLANCTFVANRAAVEGGGIMVQPGEQILRNLILRENVPDEISAEDDLDIQYSIVDDSYTGNGNIDVDPFFVDPLNGDYRLRDASPAVDAGAYLAILGSYETDLAGQPRFVDNPFVTDTGLGDPPLIDMGAYENQARSGPSVSVQPNPMIAGEDVQISVVGARPVGDTYLLYSLKGYGTTAIPALNVIVDLRSPRLAGRAQEADAEGNVSWEFQIPADAPELNVWMQGAQVAIKSNPTRSSIQH